MVIDHGGPPARGQERRQWLKANLDLGIQEDQSIPRLERGIIQALDDSNPLAA
jgi:hypothetical protein